MTQLYRTPLGTTTEDASKLAHWNRLADAIASPGWCHRGTDDRGRVITFMPANPNAWVPASYGGIEVMHVEHALWLYERIYGKPFSEEEGTCST